MNAAATPMIPARHERALHLVDLENLIGDPWATGPRVPEVLGDALVAGRYRPGDLVFVAANRWMIEELAFAEHAPCRLLPARGPDGADRRLVAEAPPEWVGRRFGRLVVGSGDHLFGQPAAEAHDLGVHVTVVVGRGALARELERAADEVVELGPPVFDLAA